MTLDEIAIRNGTDKATVHTRTYAKPHGYTIHFARCFEEIRNNAIRLLEIGVGGGESIRMWLEYFPRATVFGVDSNPNSFHVSTDRYTFVHGDQSILEFWQVFVMRYGGNWDIIVDDGGHFANQIITTFNAMWQHVCHRGFYCIEDLGVCYGPGSVFVIPGWQTHMEFIKDKLDAINQANDIDSLYFSKELAIFRKS